MIKLVVSDMDGTLTYDSADSHCYNPTRIGLPVVNQNAIRALLNQGIIFAVATGRLLADIDAVLTPELASHCYKIAQNGSFIVESSGQQLVQRHYTCELASHIYQTLQRLNIPFVSCHADHHCYHRELELAPLKAILGSNVPYIAVGADSERSNIVANICIVREQTSQLIVDKEQLLQQLDLNLVSVQITSPHTIDINPKSVNKAAGIMDVMAQLGITRDQVLVVGDSYNDLSMFLAFEHSFVMAHAPADLKKQARYPVSMFADILPWVASNCDGSHILGT